MMLNRFVTAKLIATFAVVVSTFVVPPAARAALFKPEPVLTIIAIAQDGKAVAQLSAQKLSVLPQREPTLIILSSGGSVTRGMTLKTPPNTVITMQSINGVTIRMEPDSELYVETVIAEGERYRVARGTVNFDVARKLGFFIVDHGEILVHAQPTLQAPQTNFTLVVLDAKKNIRVTVAGGRVNVDEPLALTDINKKTTVVGFDPIMLTVGQATEGRIFSNAVKSRKKVSFEDFDAAQTSFQAAIRAEADPVQQQSKIRAALAAARKFKQNAAAQEFNLMWLESVATSGNGNKALQLEDVLGLAFACVEAKNHGCAVTHYKKAIELSDTLFEDGLHAHSFGARFALAAHSKALDSKADVESILARAGELLSRAIDDSEIGAKMTKHGEINYPKLMQVNGFEANALVEMEITPSGALDAIKVLKSSHPAFEKVVLKSLLASTFSPAIRNGVAVSRKVTMPFDFRLSPREGQTIGMPFTFAKEPNPKLPSALQYDQPPVVKVVTPVVYPRHLLIDGVSGSATVRAFMGANGLVQSVEVLEATHPDFGAATKAMIQTWEFTPAMKDEEAIPNMFVYTQKFNRSEYATGFDRSSRLLLSEVNAKNSDIVEMSALDAKPKALYQPPSYDPQPLEAGKSQKETVVVEFFIDSDGAVQFPRVVSAKDMERGWAAATAMKRWIFEVPKVKGNAVAVRREIAFIFD
jgi:TonB family protein